MEWLESANLAETWAGFVPNGPVAPAAEPQVDDGSSTYVGPGGGSPAAHASAFSHFMEEVEERDEVEQAPEVSSERVDLPREEMDAQLETMTDTLNRPMPEEVTKVVKTLGDMSDAQRKEAIDDMSPAEFDALVENLPPEEHERLAPLVNATADPMRKLQMWSRAEKAELGRDGRNLGKLELDESSETKLLERAVKATEEGKVEVDDEVTNAMTQLEDPNLSDAAKKELVDGLISRKEKERAIEKQFNVNLTNDKGGETSDGMPTPRATWTEPQLRQMEVVLDRLPDEAVQENPDLKEIHRAKKDYNKKDGKWVVDEDTTGNTEDGVVEITDGVLANDEDHAGDSSEIAGIHRITELQQTLAHEVGHVMDKRNRADSRAVKNEASTDGKLDPALIPNGGAHTEGNSGDPDTWDYARTKKSDYFAEMYSKAIVAPELLYNDLVEAPRAKLQQLVDSGASAADIKAAKDASDAMQKQHAALREKVFHIDPEQERQREQAIEERADELGLDDDAKVKLMTDYRKQSQQAMTPEQLDVVFDTYNN